MDQPEKISEALIAKHLELKEQLKEQLRAELKLELTERLSVRAGREMIGGLSSLGTKAGAWASISGEVSIHGIAALLPLDQYQMAQAKAKWFQELQATEITEMRQDTDMEAAAVKLKQHLTFLRAKPTVTRKEAAEIADKSESTIDRWATDGKIMPAGSRIITASLIAFLETPRDKNTSAKVRKKPH